MFFLCFWWLIFIFEIGFSWILWRRISICLNTMLDLNLDVLNWLGLSIYVDIEVVVAIVVAARPVILLTITLYKTPRYRKISLINMHLRKWRYRLPAAYSTMFQKVIKRYHQIINKVKIIMVHLCRHDKTTWRLAVIMKCPRMLIRYQIVLDAMY